jgi:hypothetical protein
MPMGIGPGLSVTRGGSVTGIGAIGADLALWFDNDQAYKSSGGGIVTPDSILTYTAPSPKLVYGSDGVLRYANHNRFFPSADFTTTWTQTGVSVAADVITCTAGGTNHRVSRNTSVAGSQRVFFDVKAGTHSFVQIYDGANSDNYATFNLATGAVGASGTNTTASITALGGGYYRCAVTYSAAGAPNGNSFLAFASSAASVWGSTFSATGAETISVLRAQLQSAPAPVDFTYIPTTTAAVYSLPRDYNPTTGAALGVLVEEARQNLLLRSQEFGTTWAIGGNSVTADQIAAPDGTTTADMLTMVASSAVYQSVAVVASTAYMFSFWVKRGTRTQSQYRVYDNSNAANIVAATSYYSQTSSSIWTRITLAFTTPLGCISVRCYVDDSSDGATGTLYAWGAQLEAGAFATSYIPTVASQVTRARDDISILTSAFPWSQTRGTVVFEAMTEVGMGNGSYVIGLVDYSSSTNYFGVLRSSGGWVWRTGTGTATLRNFDVTTGYAENAFSKYAASYEDDVGQGMSMNGFSVVEELSDPVTKAVTTFTLGRVAALGAVHYKRLAYYNTRKSNAELQVLST